MRIFYFSLVLFLALLIALVSYSGYLTSCTDSLLEKIEALTAAAGKEDWTETEKALEDVNRACEETSRRLSLFTDHALLDEIMLTTARAKGYANYRETPELMAEIESLRTLISHIPKREQLSLYNIL